MKRQSFERICRDSNLAPVLRRECANHIILIADGWFNDHPEMSGPHYKTLWAVARNDNNLRIARPLYFAGSVGSSQQHERIAAALADATKMAEGLDGRGI